MILRYADLRVHHVAGSMFLSCAREKSFFLIPCMFTTSISIVHYSVSDGKEEKRGGDGVVGGKVMQKLVVEEKKKRVVYEGILVAWKEWKEGKKWR
jgi:hypothetical protein